MGELGNLGTDSNLFKALPDNTPYDITPTVGGMNHYSFTFPTCTPRQLTITANDIDLSTNIPEFCVGEQVILNRTWQPSLPTGCSSTNRWLVTGDYVNSITAGATPGSSSNYFIDLALLATNPSALWWYGTPGQRTVFCKETVFFANGNPSADFDTSGNVVIYRPAIVNFIDHPPAYLTNAPDFDGDLYLQLGDNNNHGDMSFEVYILSKYSGRADYTQLVNRYGVNGSLTSSPYTTYGTFDLDKYTFYLTQTDDPNVPRQVRANVQATNMLFNDNPGLQLIGTAVGGYTTSVTDTFKDYVMFRPDAGNTSSNIYVSLGKGTSQTNGSWGWSGSSTYSYLHGWSSPTGTVVRITNFDDSDAFPIWPNTYDAANPK
jgi:hypothetical protein